MKKILLWLILTITLLFPMAINAEEINLYLFHSQDCTHCQSERKWLESIKDKYDNLNIYEYEITRNSDNSALLDKVKERLSSTSNYVPYTVIGEQHWIGWNEDNKTKITEAIENYDFSKRDIVNEVINNIDGEKIGNTDDSIENNDDKTEFTVPVLGKIDAKKVSLPIMAMVIGFVDGFNPCAMWVLIFLISMLLGMKDKKKMWILGLTFLIFSGLVYLLFMLAWLNIAVSLSSIRWIQLIISAVALIGAFVNLRSYFKSVIKKDEGCEVVDNKKRKKLMERIKKYTSEKSLLLAMLGVMALAFSVNLIELACSAGLPLIFTQVLALNNLNALQYGIYIFIYLLFFLIDDIVVFVIAMKTFELTGISTKYTKYSHLIGGLIMLIIGLLMIFKPSWLMFNF
jgi:glutaredoxin